MKKKGAQATSFIGGADGPTSIFLVGKDNKNITWKQRIQRARNKARRKRIMKSLKADAHTMDEVAGYVMNELGYREIDKSDSQYQEEYCQMRTSFLLQYQPDLLGEFSNAPKLESHDEESLKKFLEQLEKRQKAAEDIPTDLFDIDEHSKRYEDVVRPLALR